MVGTPGTTKIAMGFSILEFSALQLKPRAYRRPQRQKALVFLITLLQVFGKNPKITVGQKKEGKNGQYR